jgi:hypothetical protein
MTVRLTKSALLFASVALLATPALAVEPDIDSPAGPELPAPRSDRPDFQLDDQTGAPLDPMVEGADPAPPRVVERGIFTRRPSVEIPDRDLPNPEMDDLSPTR